MLRLQPCQRQHFIDEGYLCPDESLLPPGDFADLSACFESCAADWEQRFRRRPEQMDKPHFVYPELFRWALHPGVLDLVEDLIGPDIVLFTTHFICKPPATGQRVPWHEDSAYWAGMIEPMEDVLTIWLAIDPSGPDNGCMQVVPRSHLEADSVYAAVADRDEAVFPTEINADQVAADRVRDMVLSAGQCSIHHAKLIHGSQANRGSRRRCGFTMRYFSSHCRFLHHEREPDFGIYLARGRDHAGNRYSEPFQANTDWCDRLLAGA